MTFRLAVDVLPTMSPEAAIKIPPEFAAGLPAVLTPT